MPAAGPSETTGAPRLYQTPPSRVVALFGPTLRYLMATETHVYALAVAASVLLAFFPFLLVMVSFARYVLHSREIVLAIYAAMREYFPVDLEDFIVRNLRASVRPKDVISLLLVLVAANGIFQPLEVALNKVWGVARNRSYLRNQFVALGMILTCGGLALASFVLTAAGGAATRGYELAFRGAALLVTIMALFLVYWLLPHRKIPPLSVVPVAIVVGVLLELLKYMNLLTWPWLHLRLEGEYGPFFRSVTILWWSFLAALVVLGGGEWASRRTRAAILG